MCIRDRAYLADRQFVVAYSTATSDNCDILAGVLQGSVLGLLLYILFTADVLSSAQVLVAMFADHTAILAAYRNYNVTVSHLQSAVDDLIAWINRGLIKINDFKSIGVDFMLQPHPKIPTKIGNLLIPAANSARYLGIHLDKRLT